MDPSRGRPALIPDASKPLQGRLSYVGRGPADEFPQEENAAFSGPYPPEEYRSQMPESSEQWNCDPNFLPPQQQPPENYCRVVRPGVYQVISQVQQPLPLNPLPPPPPPPMRVEQQNFLGNFASYNPNASNFVEPYYEEEQQFYDYPDNSNFGNQYQYNDNYYNNNNNYNYNYFDNNNYAQFNNYNDAYLYPEEFNPYDDPYYNPQQTSYYNEEDYYPDDNNYYENQYEQFGPEMYQLDRITLLPEPAVIDYGHRNPAEGGPMMMPNDRVAAKRKLVQMLDQKNPSKYRNNPPNFGRPMQQRGRQVAELFAGPQLPPLPKLCIRCKSYQHSALSTSELLLGYPMQIRLSRHLEQFANCIDETMSVVDDRCYEKHKTLFVQIDNVLLFDNCYEQCVWDFDVKFMSDYLPGTNRGKTEPKEFVYGITYESEDNKWRRFQNILERQNQKKVEEMLKTGHQKWDLPSGPGQSKDAAINFPEDDITDEFCAVCNDTFTSVLASMEHYESTRHSDCVYDYIVDQLLHAGIVQPTDAKYKTRTMENTIRHYTKKYRTRPNEWLCELCNVRLTSSDHGVTHFSGVMHKTKAMNALTGDKLREAAYVQKVDAFFDNPIDERAPTKRLRAAPSLPPKQKNNYFAVKRAPKNGYSGFFG